MNELAGHVTCSWTLWQMELGGGSLGQDDGNGRRGEPGDLLTYNCPQGPWSWVCQDSARAGQARGPQSSDWTSALTPHVVNMTEQQGFSDCQLVMDVDVTEVPKREGSDMNPGGTPSDK